MGCCLQKRTLRVVSTSEATEQGCSGSRIPKGTQHARPFSCAKTLMDIELSAQRTKLTDFFAEYYTECGKGYAATRQE